MTWHFHKYETVSEAKEILSSIFSNFFPIYVNHVVRTKIVRKCTKCGKVKTHNIDVFHNGHSFNEKCPLMPDYRG